ncbi:hypothetical protein NRIC_27890 [Enterococcus florum]|uniref:MapZ extracellular domain-containing protein n=1 Tax=Enterococcus florum TaxID=2480627 RepID=A0A4P5PF86_9ENTE|nr:hypothetical protein [Enterococcus florum]GCF94898.1 hypothetical protein NRIC_27890 [Enterococcus florum]
MSRKTIIWVVIGVLVTGALSFAGYRVYQDRKIETKIEVNKAFSQKLKKLYSDQESGYFKSDLSEEAFDSLLTQVSNSSEADESQMTTAIDQAKKDFQIQSQVNELFETEVLNGMALSAKPVLKAPDSQQTIPDLEQQIGESPAKDKSWGQDIQMILSIAKEQSVQFDEAEKTIGDLADQRAVSLSDYLTGVQTVALLPDGDYKESLLTKLDSVKTELNNANAQFASSIAQDEQKIEAEAEKYRKEKAKVLEAKSKELSKLKTEINQKRLTYESYARISRSREQSGSRSSESEDSVDSSSSSSSTTESTSEESSSE